MIEGTWFVCLFYLNLYFPVNNFSVMSGRVFLGCTSTSTKQGLMCLAHMALRLLLKSHFCLKNVIILSLQLCYGRHNVSRNL